MLATIYVSYVSYDNITLIILMFVTCFLKYSFKISFYNKLTHFLNIEPYTLL